MNGLLGLSEEETDNVIYTPTQVAIGANHNLQNESAVKIKCGRFHTVVATKNGHIYTWGEGSQCRLGLGFIEEN
jgi:alpha-tubulin suppressor-like RCC1 family protein